MARFQNIEISEDLLVEGQIKVQNQEVEVKGHTHSVNTINGLDDYFNRKITEDTNFVVQDSLHFSGYNIFHFFQVDNPLYNQVEQRITQILEVITPNRDLFIKVNDGNLLQPLNYIIINNREIVYDKRTNKILIGDINIENFDDLKLLTNHNGEKYIYIKENPTLKLLINNQEIVSALKDFDTELSEEKFNLDKSISFKSLDFFESTEEVLPLPLTVGYMNPLQLKRYKKINKDYLKYFMLPRENVALLFIYSDFTYGMFYIDKTQQAYSANLLDEYFGTLEIVNEFDCNLLKLNEEFLENIDSVYLMEPSVVRKLNLYTGIETNDTIDITTFVRPTDFSYSETMALDAFVGLFNLSDDFVETTNMYLAQLLHSKKTTINGVEFALGDDITITATATGGNADTLSNLNLNNFILARDVVEGDGKIARFDKDGHLIFPDGHTEWIE